MHSSLPNLVHKGGLTFWIDLQGCWSSCSCSTAAAAAGLFTDIRQMKVANWIVQKVIYLVRLNLVHNDFLIFWIDSKECCWCSCRCSTTTATAALLLQLQHWYCSCSTFSSHKPKFDSYMPNNSICSFYQPDFYNSCSCSCSCSTLLNQWWISNYICIPSFVKMNKLHPKLCNLLHF